MDTLENYQIKYTEVLGQGQAVLAKIDWRKIVISVNYPIFPKMARPEIKIFRLRADVSDKKLASLGYRHATLMELLILGTRHQNLQRQFPILSTGFVWVRRNFKVTGLILYVQFSPLSVNIIN